MSWLIYEIKAFWESRHDDGWIGTWQSMIAIFFSQKILHYHLFQRSKINVSFQSQDLKTISLQISELCNEFGIADWFHLSSTHFNLIGWSVIVMAIICLMIVIMLSFRQLLILRIHYILMLPKITKNNAGRKAYALFIFYLCHCQWSGKAATIAS